METTLDRFGRIIIPKGVRDDMGLEAGAVLQIEKKGEKIILQPVQGEPKITEKKGFSCSPALPSPMSEPPCTNIGRAG